MLATDHARAPAFAPCQGGTGPITAYALLTFDCGFPDDPPIRIIITAGSRVLVMRLLIIVVRVEVYSSIHSQNH